MDKSETANILKVDVDKLTQYAVIPILELMQKEKLPLEMAVLKHLNEGKMLKHEIAYFFTIGLDLILEGLAEVISKEDENV